MITQFSFALKDIRKNIWLIIAFIFQLSLAFLFISLLSNELIKEQQNQQQFKNIYKNQFISFKLYRNQSKNLKVGEELDNLLTKTLDGNKNAYSTITTTLSESTLANGSNLEVVVGLGGFSKLFDIQPKIKGNNTSEAIVLMGSKVKNHKIGDDIEIGTFALNPLKVSESLPRGASYVDSNGTHYLDDSIVILTTWKSWKDYNELDYIEQIIGNIKLVDINEESAAEFAQGISMANQKYDIVPININDIKENKKDTAKGQSVFLLFFISMIIMICVGVTSSLMQLVDNNLKEYAIHRLYGAELKDIYIRIIIYSTIIIAIPFLPVCFILRSYPPEMLSFIPIIFISIFVLMIITVTVYPILRLKHQDITAFLRRDV
jgi:hypothetical protein